MLPSVSCLLDESPDYRRGSSKRECACQYPEMQTPLAQGEQSKVFPNYSVGAFENECTYHRRGCNKGNVAIRFQNLMCKVWRVVMTEGIVFPTLSATSSQIEQ